MGNKQSTVDDWSGTRVEDVGAVRGYQITSWQMAKQAQGGGCNGNYEELKMR